MPIPVIDVARTQLSEMILKYVPTALAQNGVQMLDSLIELARRDGAVKAIAEVQEKLFGEKGVKTNATN